jgi:hypothetical protein
MGASGWDSYVPYQEDLATALEQLRQRVFAEGAQEAGTHSIFDMFALVRADEQAGIGRVQPVSAAEASQVAGTDVLTREHVRALGDGRPHEIYFWGFSGD